MRAHGARGPGIFPKRFSSLLSDEHADYAWPSFRQWISRASAADLIAAFEASRNALMRQIICDAVGSRDLHAATPLLVHALSDPTARVRSSAADALGKLAEPATGADFLARYVIETDPGVRANLILGLGSTQYRAGLSVIIEALNETEPAMRYCAAWALKAQAAREALPALERALASESEEWVVRQIQRAIHELRYVNPP